MRPRVEPKVMLSGSTTSGSVVEVGATVRAAVVPPQPLCRTFVQVRPQRATGAYECSFMPQQADLR